MCGNAMSYLRVAGLLLALGVWYPAPAAGDSHVLPEESEPYDAYGELYRDGDYRLARPGQRPVSNFYNRPRFTSIDPGCSGVLSMEISAAHPAFPSARMYFYEQIRVRPTRLARRFPQRFSWEIRSDPFEMMGVVTTAEGAGSGRARVWLTLDMVNGIYRLITDITPRDDVYEISSSGAGISHMVFEDFFFGFADHHYSYVDLSGLQGAGAAGAAAMQDISHILSNRPPNVFMGFIDWTEIGDVDGEVETFVELRRDEEMSLSYYGLEFSGVRTTDIRILCEPVIRQIQRHWPRD